MKVNTYGLKIKGLKKASGKTYNAPDGLYFEIFYDKETEEVWTIERQGGNWSDDERKIGTAYRHVTMQNIVHMIKGHAHCQALSEKFN